MSVRRFEPEVQLDNGLIIPAGALYGNVLGSNSSGSAAWTRPPTDALQPGVVGNDFAPGSLGGTITINSSTGALSMPAMTATAGGAWVSGPAAGDPLVNVQSIASAILSPSLPTSGNNIGYLVGINYLGQWSILGTTASASSAIIPTSSMLSTVGAQGYLGIAGFVINNTSGSYSATMWDRRPWSRGAYNGAYNVPGSNYTTTSTSLVAIDTTHLQVRLECSGVPIEVSVKCCWSNSSSSANNFMACAVDGTHSGGWATQTITSSGALFDATLHSVITGLAAGSHLFTLQWSTTAGTATLYAETVTGFAWAAGEQVYPNLNNGTT